MFTYNLLSMLETLKPKAAKKTNRRDFLDIGYEHYTPPPPGEIRKVIENLSRCSNCCFIIFDNYWIDEIENIKVKVCPTCGHRL